MTQPSRGVWARVCRSLPPLDEIDRSILPDRIASALAMASTASSPSLTSAMTIPHRPGSPGRVKKS